MANKKTIAIFGAGTGLGASLATRFGREGYRVALVARRAAPLEERVAELTRAGIEVAAFPADLTNLDSIPALVRSIEARFGAIDVAVACAALSRSWRGVSVTVATEVRLLAARHPLLDPAHAVPIERSFVR